MSIKIKDFKEWIAPHLSKEELDVLEFKNKSGKFTIFNKLFNQAESYYFHSNGLIPEDLLDSFIMHCKAISNYKPI